MQAYYNPTVAGKPWGGCQLIVNGDINQATNLKWGNDPAWVGFEDVTYTWDLPMWNEWFDLAVILTHVHRTRDKDPMIWMYRRWLLVAMGRR